MGGLPPHAGKSWAKGVKIFAKKEAKKAKKNFAHLILAIFGLIWAPDCPLLMPLLARISVSAMRIGGCKDLVLDLLTRSIT